MPTRSPPPSLSLLPPPPFPQPVSHAHPKGCPGNYLGEALVHHNPLQVVVARQRQDRPPCEEERCEQHLPPPLTLRQTEIQLPAGQTGLAVFVGTRSPLEGSRQNAGSPDDYDALGEWGLGLPFRAACVKS